MAIIHVETVSPTWKPTGQQYWLELLTRPPMHIVAAGVPEKLYFKSFKGEVAIIPKREQDGRYTYRSTRPTPTPPKPQSASASKQDPTVTDAMLSQDLWQE